MPFPWPPGGRPGEPGGLGGAAVGIGSWQLPRQGRLLGHVPIADQERPQPRVACRRQVDEDDDALGLDVGAGGELPPQHRLVRPDLDALLEGDRLALGGELPPEHAHRTLGGFGDGQPAIVGLLPEVPRPLGLDQRHAHRRPDQPVAAHEAVETAELVHLASQLRVGKAA